MEINTNNKDISEKNHSLNRRCAITWRTTQDTKQHSGDGQILALWTMAQEHSVHLIQAEGFTFDHKLRAY